jgi:hypothetical protein
MEAENLEMIAAIMDRGGSSNHRMEMLDALPDASIDLVNRLHPPVLEGLPFHHLNLETWHDYHQQHPNHLKFFLAKNGAVQA